MRRCAPAALLLGALLFGCNAEPQAAPVPTGSTQADEPETAPSKLPLVPVRIRSGGRNHEFMVEVAQTPEEQAQGLMFRKSLGPKAGMLFPFNPPRPASFWMKNTLIPLDMIFIRTDGTIESIAANTVPQSQEQSRSKGTVAAVLEIAGGRAAELGLTPGDAVVWTGGPQP